MARDSAQVILDVGKPGGLKMGMKLKVSFGETAMRPPVAGQVQPEEKEWLAEIEVTYVDEKMSEVKVIQWLTKPGKRIKMGDKFRVFKE